MTTRSVYRQNAATPFLQIFYINGRKFRRTAIDRGGQRMGANLYKVLLVLLMNRIWVRLMINSSIRSASSDLQLCFLKIHYSVLLNTSKTTYHSFNFNPLLIFTNIYLFFRTLKSINLNIIYFMKTKSQNTNIRLIKYRSCNIC